MKNKEPSAELSFLQKYRAAPLPGLPKYAQLQRALAAAIDDGLWAPGAQLPTEVQLTRLTTFSLGTVQKAIGGLAREGRVIRLHGRGTFVAPRKKPVEEPVIHVHFLDDEGTGYLPVYPKVISRKLLAEPGPWSSLGQQGENIVCIEREFNVNDEFSAFSRFYMNTQRFGSFARKPPAKLDGANFKRILAEEFGVAVKSYSQDILLQKMPADACDVLKVRRGTLGITLSIVAYAEGHDPVYYQELFIPPNPRRLKLPDIVQGGY